MNEYAANHIRRVFSKLDIDAEYEIYTNNIRSFGTQPECIKITNDKQVCPIELYERDDIQCKSMHKMIWVDELIQDIRFNKVTNFILAFEDVYVDCTYRSDTKWIVETSFGYHEGEPDYEGYMMSTGTPSTAINCKRVPVQAKGILNCYKLSIWLNALSLCKS